MIGELHKGAWVWTHFVYETAFHMPSTMSRHDSSRWCWKATASSLKETTAVARADDGRRTTHVCSVERATRAASLSCVCIIFGLKGVATQVCCALVHSCPKLKRHLTDCAFLH